MSKIRGPCTYSGVTEASDSGGIDSETQSEIVNCAGNVKFRNEFELHSKRKC